MQPVSHSLHGAVDAEPLDEAVSVQAEPFKTAMEAEPLAPTLRLGSSTRVPRGPFGRKGCCMTVTYVANQAAQRPIFFTYIPTIVQKCKWNKPRIPVLWFVPDCNLFAVIVVCGIDLLYLAQHSCIMLLINKLGTFFEQHQLRLSQLRLPHYF